MKLKRGDIFIWSGTSWPAYFIKKITNSQWSHCGWVLSEDEIIDADWDGVHRRPSAKYTDHPERLRVFRLNIPEEQIEKCLEFALSKEGTFYDYKLLSSMFWAYMRGKKCCRDAREWNKGYICSELLAEPLSQFANIYFLEEGVDLDFTAPEDVAAGIVDHAEEIL